MLDPVLIGSALTGVMALLSQAVGKCKCRVTCKRDEAGEYCEPACVCGFLDAPLFQISEEGKDEATHNETSPQ